MRSSRTVLASLVSACLCAAPASAQAPCTGDLDADRVVDGNDLGVLLGAWGACSGCVSDINSDGFVDGADLGFLLNGWGTCPVVTPTWATLVEAVPDPMVVTEPVLRQRIAATGWAWRVRHTTTQIEMLLVPPGTFLMGCIVGSDDYGCLAWEQPPHPVTLTGGFYLGRYEVTQSQWASAMGAYPSVFQSASAIVPADQVNDRPVESVSWDAVQEYLSATGMRLPTEAEWEHACRAGTQTPFHNGSADDGSMRAIAWYSPNARNQTHPVGGKAANALGFHDMLGNVWEWVNDWFAPYQGGAQTDPAGPAQAPARVIRGGSFSDGTINLRSSNRDEGTPRLGYVAVGFRVAKDP